MLRRSHENCFGDDDLAFMLQPPDYFEAQVDKSFVVGIAKRSGQEDQRRATLVDIPIARECPDESLPFMPIREDLVCPEHPSAERIDLGPSDEITEPGVELSQSNCFTPSGMI
jgi:hypothetical protein